MDEKTAELRDLFVEVTDEETVTESQAETPGSLVSGDDPDERLADVVAEMRAALDFATDLPDAALVAVVRGYYGGESDADIAADVDADVDADVVAEARLDMHLIRDDDVPVDADAVRTAVDEGADDAALAERFDVRESAVRRARRAVVARRESRRVNRRYRDQFESILDDRDIAERMTGDEAEDELAGATEGQEVDVNF
ncbi:MAG: conditioned medium-induced protein 4 [Halobacteriaceae archaeon]